MLLWHAGWRLLAKFRIFFHTRVHVQVDVGLEHERDRTTSCLEIENVAQAASSFLRFLICLFIVRRQVWFGWLVG